MTDRPVAMRCKCDSDRAATLYVQLYSQGNGAWLCNDYIHKEQ
jgi:hypothetical protein